MFNDNEKHLVIGTNDGKKLAMKGNDKVMFVDVLSGDMGIKMMMMLGGAPNSHLGVPFMIFQNSGSSYPIRGLPETFPRVCYRTGQKGWMDRRVFSQWISEYRVLPKLPNGRKRVFFVDNATRNSMNEAVKDALLFSNTELRYFPKNVADLCQPADSFVIQMIKTC